MKKAIEVKGQIKIDKREMKEIRAGSCAQYGVVCENVWANPEQRVEQQSAAVDDLYLG
jgi:hypothetical protein